MGKVQAQSDKTQVLKCNARTMQCYLVEQVVEVYFTKLRCPFFTLSKWAQEVATGKCLDQYLVAVDEFEKVIGENISVADYAKHEKLNTSWKIPIGCNES